MSDRSQYIFLPIFGMSMMIIIITICVWKRFYRRQRPIYPYNNPQIAFVTQTYQRTWPLPSVEEPPPSYNATMNTAMFPPIVSYIKE
jgi:hypothetical protein